MFNSCYQTKNPRNLFKIIVSSDINYIAHTQFKMIHWLFYHLLSVPHFVEKSTFEVINAFAWHNCLTQVVTALTSWSNNISSLTCTRLNVWCQSSTWQFLYLPSIGHIRFGSHNGQGNCKNKKSYLHVEVFDFQLKLEIWIFDKI